MKKIPNYKFQMTNKFQLKKKFKFQNKAQRPKNRHKGTEAQSEEGYGLEVRGYGKADEDATSKARHLPFVLNL